MLALLAHAAAADLSVAASDRGFRFRSDLSVTVTDGPKECGAPSKVKAGDKLKMHYTGTIDASSASGEKGKQFDSSRDRGATFDFEIGAGRVIRGWDEGLVGLCKGAKATLIIPPALGYGDRGAGADIPGGATLRFDVEVVDVAGSPSAMHSLLAEKSKPAKSTPKVQDKTPSMCAPMENFFSVQYVTSMTVGTPTQVLRAIPDTGSFVLVVTSTQCEQADCTECAPGTGPGSSEPCAKHQRYNSSSSTTFNSTDSGSEMTVTYGQGTVTGPHGFDHIRLGEAEAQINFLMMHANTLDGFNIAYYDAVLGLSKDRMCCPEVEEASCIVPSGGGARKCVGPKDAKACAHVGGEVRSGECILTPVRCDDATKDECDDSVPLSTFEKDGTRGLSRFGLCLGSKPGAGGRLDLGGGATGFADSDYTTLESIGEHHWALSLTAISAGDRVVTIGGADGWGASLGPDHGQSAAAAAGAGTAACAGPHHCAAIVDSGTSLLAFPKDVVAALKAAIGAELLAKYATRSTCGDLAEFPNLVLTLGGHNFTLAPHMYMAEMIDETVGGEFSSQDPTQKGIKKATSVKASHRFRSGPFTLDALPNTDTLPVQRLDEGQQVVCAPLFLSMDVQTQDHGPMVILGMPFLREYAARFDRDAKTVALARSKYDPALGDISDICAGCGTDLAGGNHGASAAAPAVAAAAADVPGDTALQPSGIGGGAPPMLTRAHTMSLRRMRLPHWALRAGVAGRFAL